MIRILSFIIFIIGIIFITIGFAHQNSPTYTSKKKFEFVPRSVFDEIAMNTSLSKY